jgi:hypothetical protein
MLVAFIEAGYQFYAVDCGKTGFTPLNQSRQRLVAE